MNVIYLDNNAATRCDDRVIEAIRASQAGCYANPLSLSYLGKMARDAIDRAARKAAALLGCERSEIVFTSGGAESINLALRGVMGRAAGRGLRHVVSSPVEHPVTKMCLEQLHACGCEIVELPLNDAGAPDTGRLDECVRDDTVLITLVGANSETGVKTDIEAASRFAASRGIPLHVDATQLAGRSPINLSGLEGVCLLSVSAHKFHGPGGVGALFVRRGTRIIPQIPGPQQRGLRGGSEDTSGIVGMGLSAELAAAELGETMRRCSLLRDELAEGIIRRIDNAEIIPAHADRLCNTLCVGFRGLPAEKLVASLDRRGVCVSSGSACQAGRGGPSEVLLAMGVDAQLAAGAIRISLSRMTTQEDIDGALAALDEAVPECRGEQAVRATSSASRVA